MSYMPMKDGRQLFFLLLTGSLCLLIFPTWMDWSFSQSKGNPSAGKVTYEKWCSACHGKQGEGLGNMPNFRDPQYMSSRTDQDLFQKITDGGRGTGMPPFASRLAEQDRWNVIAYIRALSSNP
jgi:mono/diheme cytochrome c family protein